MNIYFDYDSTPSTYNIVGKHLSKIIMRIKTDIMQLTYTTNRNANRAMPDGFILVKISGINGSVKVFGFDDELRKELSNVLKLINLSNIIQLGSKA